ncbi:ABC transporter permease [Rubrobacter marinus]|nr:iron ABC transporter permease [Rubrobacter marinus]
MTVLPKERVAAKGAKRRPRGKRPPALVALPAALVALAMVLPLLYLAIRASEAGLTEISEVVFDASSLEVLARSVLLAAVVTAVAVGIAVPLAWLTARTDLPGRRVWAVLAALPLVVPSYVGGLVLVSTLGPRGLLQGALAPLGVERLPSIYGLPGAALALSLFTYPYVFLTVRAALRGMDSSFEEAARSLGSGRWATFFRITLPQLRPAIVAGALLVALYALSDFGAVSLLHYDTFSAEIYIQYKSAFDRTPAAILALMLVVLVAAVLAVEHRTRGRANYGGRNSAVARPVPLGRWRLPALLFTGGVVSLALVLPVGILVYWLVRGLAAGETLESVWESAWNSVFVSGLAAGVAVLAALPVAVLAVRFPGRVSGFVERLSYVGFALPAIALALALVFFGSNYAPALYQTLALLVFAYVVHFLPQALGAIRAALLQARPSVEEAARSLGRGPLGVLATITVPLARNGLVAGAALVFLTTMKELPATLLLGPIEFDTLATEVWNATSGAFFARAAGPALLLILISAPPLYLLTIRDRVK